MIRYFASHPTAANLLMVLIITAGLLAVPTLKRTTFPDFALGEVGIEVEYRGASADEIEQAICQRLEDAILGLTDLGELRCEAREGFANAVAEIAAGGDFDRFMDEIKTQVNAIETFPERAKEPVIEELERTDFVAQAVVAGPMRPFHLRQYAADLRDRLRALPEVSQVNLHGFSDQQLRITVSAQAVQQFGVSAADIARTIARQGIDLPVGLLETADRDVLVRFEDQRETPEALADLIVVAAASGAELRLGDIATIHEAFEREEDKIVTNGTRAAVLEIRKTEGEDALRVIDAVREFLDAERARAPPTVTLTISQNLSVIVRDRLTMLAENGAFGLALVFLVMWLFFQPRFAFWVVVGLPVSFLGTFAVMTVLGYSINMITMVALLMAIGLLMDDAIVLSENMAARLQQGEDAVEAVIGGTIQVAPGVLASFATTLAVFGPMAFLSGDIGRVLNPLPVVLIVTLAVSFIEAFLILPHHLVEPLRQFQEKPGSRLRQRFERGFETVRERVLGRAADLAVSWRYPFLGLLLFIAIASVGLVAGGLVRFQALPEIEGNVIVARLALPQGTPLERTEAVAERIVAALARVDAALSPEQPNGEPLVRQAYVQYGVNQSVSERGAHVATVVVDLLEAERRTVDLDTIYDRWQEAIGTIPNLVSLILQEPDFGPQGRPIEIRVQGEDLDALKAAALDLQDYLSPYGGVHDVVDDMRPGKPELRLRLLEGATSLGLDAATIAEQLRSAFLGNIAQEIQVGDQEYEIEVEQAPMDRDSLADLLDFRVSLPDGSQVPLVVVASVEPTRGWARINRIDGRRTVTVQGDVDTRIANTIDIINTVEREYFPTLKSRYPGIELQIEGQSQEAAKTSQSIRRGFLIGLLGVFLVLAFQFRSYLEPLVVMAIIPLALIGALWGHLLMGYAISMPSLVGAVSLAGVVVNDSILLVRFVKLRTIEGREVGEAAKLASRDRFRAVLLTSLTTILGLVPLLAETSAQAQILKPLVISVVFGLLASTVLVLLVVPSLYAILNDLGLANPRRGAAKRPAAA